jgi:hypothetical protein
MRANGSKHGHTYPYFPFDWFDRVRPVTADRQWLLRDSMRLEDAEPDHLKPLWIIASPEETFERGEEVLIVEALTAPGARAVAETLGLLGPFAPDLKFAGPIARAAWPQGLWYRWLTTEDMADFFARYLPELPKPGT